MPSSSIRRQAPGLELARGAGRGEDQPQVLGGRVGPQATLRPAGLEQALESGGRGGVGAVDLGVGRDAGDRLADDVVAGLALGVVL